jgi:polysaccharide chain length determinant protein (PEP-CTERM system associated)
MLGHREMTMEDYADILRRRFWLILGSAVLFLGIGIGVTFIIQPRYQSQTLILIEQQKIPEDYVKPVVDQDLSGRLATMKEQILSRSRIEPIIRQFNLFSKGNPSMDDRVEMMQKAIGVKPIPASQSSHGMPGFYITFIAQDAQTAQQVCAKIESLFVSENLSAREQSAEGTTEFLKQQLDDSKKSLDQQDAKLAVFQEKYFGRLPDQEQSNSNTLQALTTQLDAVTQSLNRQQQEVTFLSAMVSQQTRELQTPEPAAAAAVDERKIELKALIAQQQALEAQYTPDHPDVVEVRRKVADLRAEIARTAAEPATAAPAPVVNRADPPQLQQLKAQLRAAQQAMVDLKQDQARIVEQVRSYESRIESSPAVEEEYKQITRDHDTALDFYNSLLKKMNESSMATALEQRQQGEQFHIQDAPNFPEEPIFPNRRIFGLGGLAAGLFAGLLLAGLLEYRDTSLRNERDVWAFTKLSTLAVISYIDSLPQAEKPHVHRKFFSRTNKPIESVLG